MKFIIKMLGMIIASFFVVSVYADTLFACPQTFDCQTKPGNCVSGGVPAGYFDLSTRPWPTRQLFFPSNLIYTFSSANYVFAPGINLIAIQCNYKTSPGSSGTIGLGNNANPSIAFQPNPSSQWLPTKKQGWQCTSSPLQSQACAFILGFPVTDFFDLGIGKNPR